MNIGLAGMPESGKSTLFRVMTGLRTAAESGARGKPFPGVIDLPDSRLEKLAAYYKPKKTTPFRIYVLDIPGPGPAHSEETSKSLPPRFIADMRTMDVLGAVIRGFTATGSGPELAGKMRSFRDEIIFQDFDVVDKKHLRLLKGEKEGFFGEKELIEKIKAHLESENEIRTLNLPEDTLRLLSGYAFLTLKPIIYILNLSENQPLADDEKTGAFIEGKKQNAAVVPLYGKLELDLLELPEDERKEFLTDVGLSESGMKTLIQSIFGSLNLIMFFTAVGNELRAWGVPAGTSVLKAAGKIHTDMERGFIKADVMPYNDFSRLGSEAACRKEGKIRQEGKSYIVQNADILTIKFNV